MHGIIFSFSVGTSLGPLLAAPFLGTQPQISGGLVGQELLISNYTVYQIGYLALLFSCISHGQNSRYHRTLPAHRVLGFGERLELPRARTQRLPGTENGEEDRS